MNEEPVFKNYKERSNYYKERYKNRGRVIHTSIIYDKNGNVIQPGRTYRKEEVLYSVGPKIGK